MRCGVVQEDFLSAWEFVWSCGKCGWCLLSCLRLGSSLLSPVRSPLPWSVLPYYLVRGYGAYAQLREVLE
ncbi:hypothetical protein DY000_02003637 [Brassica cretica]|uniref:Uncharacterized protein n=1 Tax=Brassica cretica TaxID=69181 RepID=A0ABQ7C1M8_BRACR|nr:hypothetical protein DY000_02003637 [Brassica cretica]